MSAPQRYRSGAYGAMVADDNGPWVQANAEWQPIESAPKDGTEVLCGGKVGRMRVCWFVDGSWVFHQKYGGARIVLLHPTHWMPLPEPPK